MKIIFGDGALKGMEIFSYLHDTKPKLAKTFKQADKRKPFAYDSPFSGPWPPPGRKTGRFRLNAYFP